MGSYLSKLQIVQLPTGITSNQLECASDYLCTSKMLCCCLEASKPLKGNETRAYSIQWKTKVQSHIATTECKTLGDIPLLSSRYCYTSSADSSPICIPTFPRKTSHRQNGSLRTSRTSVTSCHIFSFAVRCGSNW